MATNASDSSKNTANLETSSGCSSLQSHGFQKTALGFLDLPTEIRLEIYGYLLLASTICSPQDSKTSYNDLGPLVRFSFRYGTETGFKISVAGDIQFCPAILMTCRAVHEEATALLYGENIFSFWVPNDRDDEFNQDCSFLEHSERKFQYNDKDWQRIDGADQLWNSIFACFLNQIGPRNATSLKSIELAAGYCKIGKCGFRLVASLLERHVAGLKSIAIFLRAMLRLTHADQEEEVRILCSILTKLVHGCPSLKEFSYAGSGFDAVPDLEAKTEYLGELLQHWKKREKKKVPRLEKDQEKEG